MSRRVQSFVLFAQPMKTMRYLPIYQFTHKTTLNVIRSRNYTSASRENSGNESCRLTNVVITGGSSGIGYAIAEALVKARNYKVLIMGRNHDKLKQATESLRQTCLELHPEISRADLEHHVIALQADVADPATWTRPFQRVEEQGISWQMPDVLVNAAGTTHSSLLSAMSTKALYSDEPMDVESIVNTNLMGTIYACRAVSKIMLRYKSRYPSPQHSPCIINISSILAVRGGRGSSVYSASKAGVLGFTRALSAELGAAGIRVNAIVPGYIETSMTEAINSNVRANALENIPLKRFGKTEEVAEAALFLLRNEYANNCTINLDGGLSAAL